jgi:hypothetical protein
MLYADTIEVLSLGNQMIRNLNVLAAGQSTNLLPVLDSLGDKTLRHLSPGVDVQQLRQMIPILGGVDPEAVRSLAAADPEMQQLADFADVLDEGQATMNSAMADLRVVTEQMHVDSGVAELELAVARRLLRFNDAVP